MLAPGRRRTLSPNARTSIKSLHAHEPGEHASHRLVAPGSTLGHAARPAPRTSSARGPRSTRPHGIDDLAAVLQDAWRADTAWIDDWHPRNPPRGQCGSTALVVQDLRGGVLMRGLVEECPGHGKLTVHYWNTVDIGQLDLTWQQFPAAARVVLGEPAERADLLTSRWLTERYERLRTRVASAWE